MTTTDTNNSLQVSVWRGSAQGGEYQQFRVPSYDNQTVLDVVSWIQQHSDATLSYRFACRVGMCGSCAMTINGEPRWTCRTHINKVAQNGSLTIAPLRNLPVIKDLVTDMDLFFNKWIEAGGVHQPSATRDQPMVPVDPAGNRRQAASEAIECINCAVCYSACDTVASNPDYLGPAALQRAWTLVNDEKNNNTQQTLNKVTGSGGCHSCHSMGSCTRYCPVELNPLKSIAGLKKATALAFITKRR